MALAARSDFLFVTLAASAATRHIVGAKVIEALGPEGMLINISRASNIDEEALLTALEAGKLGSAALDVFEGEPKLNPRFLAAAERAGAAASRQRHRMRRGRRWASWCATT